MPYTIEDIENQLGSFTNDVTKAINNNYRSIVGLTALLLNRGWDHDFTIDAFLKCACLRMIVFIKTHPDIGDMLSREASGYIAWYADAFYNSLPNMIPSSIRGKLYSQMVNMSQQDFIKHFYQQTIFLYQMTMNYNSKKYFLPYDGGILSSRIIQADPNDSAGFFLALSSMFAHDLFYDLHVTGFAFRVNAYSSNAQCPLPKNTIDYAKGVNNSAYEIHRIITSKVR